MDNGVGDESNTVVEKLTGEDKMPDRSPSYTDTMPRIMSQGKFSINHMIEDGECRKEFLEKFGGSTSEDVGEMDTAEDTNNLQLFWKMVELTKATYSRMAGEYSIEKKLKAKEKADTLASRTATLTPNTVLRPHAKRQYAKRHYAKRHYAK